MPLFEVAILEIPSQKSLDEGSVERLVLGPVAVVARDVQSAGIAAILQKGDAPAFDIARATVLVRPFA